MVQKWMLWPPFLGCQIHLAFFLSLQFYQLLLHFPLKMLHFFQSYLRHQTNQSFSTYHKFYIRTSRTICHSLTGYYCLATLKVLKTKLGDRQIFFVCLIIGAVCLGSYFHSIRLQLALYGTPPANPQQIKKKEQRAWDPSCQFLLA
jgi:hypothetical protein